MLSLHVLSAGDGYTYYTDSVALGDEGAQKGQEMNDYYLASGNPEGVWEGSGVARLGLKGTVTEEQMRRLYGLGLHPTPEMLDEGQKEQLGRAYYQYAQPESRLQKAMNRRLEEELNRTGKQKLSPDERRALRHGVAARFFREAHGGRDPRSREEFVRYIQTQTNKGQQAVAGFDLTFAPAKSVSVLWAMADEPMKRRIEAIHEATIRDALKHLEENYFFTRGGFNGVRTLDTGGMVASRFRHYDSRTGDAHLHDHVVISNKVYAPAEQKWLSVDSQSLHAGIVAVGSFYNQQIMDRLETELGLSTRLRTEGVKEPVREIAGVTDELIDVASGRRAQIKTVLDELTRAWVEDHGYQPTDKQKNALAQQATLMTRPEKDTTKTLVEKVAAWRQRYGKQMGEKDLLTEVFDPHSAVNHAPKMLGPANVFALAEEVLENVEQRRAVFKYTHLEAEARRTVSATTAQANVTDAELTKILELASAKSLLLTPRDQWESLEGLTRADGSSVFQRPVRELFTTEKTLATEASMIANAHLQVIPVASNELFEEVVNALPEAQRDFLNEQQKELARRFVTDETLVTVGIGPAGAGKTTALRLVADVVHEAGGTVYGVAPSSAAAAVLSGELGIGAETIDKLLHQWDNGNGPALKHGDVLIVDEAGMTSTPNLGKLLEESARRGVKVNLIGDDAQLSAVGAGGAFRMLSHEIEPVRLEQVHRFRNLDGSVNEAEAIASIALRDPVQQGADKPFDWYLTNGRIVSGDAQTMTEMAFEAWSKDARSGKDSLMAAATETTVNELNRMAQAQKIAHGELNTEGRSAALHDDIQAYVGDTILTRQNDRRLVLGNGQDYVRNGQTWHVKSVDANGRMMVQNTQNGLHISLPQEYVKQHVQLGYASTIHRTQGMTVDTIHSVMTASVSRSLAYVAMTRGREANRMYLVPNDGQSMHTALESIAGRHDENLTAHEQASLARAAARSLDLAAEEVSSVQDHMDTQRVAHLTRQLAGVQAGPIVDSPAFEAVVHHARVAAECNIDPRALLKEAFEQKDTAYAQDPAAVLAWRMKQRLATATEHHEALQHRPFAAIPDEHLGKLITRAQQRLGEQAEQAKALAVEGMDWVNRPLGHKTDQQLSERLLHLLDHPGQDAAHEMWERIVISREIQARRTMLEPQKQAENLTRGLYGGHADGTARAMAERADREQALLTRLVQEKSFREAIPQSMEYLTQSRRTTRVPEWLVRRDTLAFLPGVSNEHRLQRDARLRDLQEKTLHAGTRVATERPEWSKALGDVPSVRRRAYDWYRTAGEIEAFRQKYKVPASETKPIPDTLAEHGTAKALKAQITAVHKYGAQTSKPLPAPEKVQGQLQDVQTQREQAEKRTPAEKKIAQLADAQGQKMKPAERPTGRAAALTDGQKRILQQAPQTKGSSRSQVKTQDVPKMQRDRELGREL